MRPGRWRSTSPPARSRPATCHGLWPAALAPEARTAALAALPAGLLRDTRLRGRFRLPDSLDRLVPEQASSTSASPAPWSISAAAGGSPPTAPISPSRPRRTSCGWTAPCCACRPPAPPPASLGQAAARPTIRAEGVPNGPPAPGAAGSRSGWMRSASPTWPAIGRAASAARAAGSGSGSPATSPPARSATAIGGSRPWRPDGARMRSALTALTRHRGGGRCDGALAAPGARRRRRLRHRRIHPEGNHPARPQRPPGLTAGARSALDLREGLVRFFNLDADPGNAEITLQVAGPLAEAVTLLKHPRLKLFERRPLNAGASPRARPRPG